VTSYPRCQRRLSAQDAVTSRSIGRKWRDCLILSSTICVMQLAQDMWAGQNERVNLGAISGVVSDGASGAPVAGAVVSLGRGGDSELLPRMITDSRGRFVFTNLPSAADYSLYVSGFGYAPTRFGWSAPYQSPAPEYVRRIAVADGQWVTDIKIPLWHPGSITGRVVDERDEPVVGAAVQAFAMAEIAGLPRPVGGPVGTTDDRGFYRLAGLPAGRYVVSVLSVQSTATNGKPEPASINAVGYVPGGFGTNMPDNGAVATYGIDVDGLHRLVLTRFATPPPPGGYQSRSYPAIFYPSATAIADATPLDVRYSSNRDGVDFRLVPVSAVRVSGHIETGGKEVPPLWLRLMRQGTEVLGFGAEAATTSTEADGRFTFLNVPAGEFTLIAQASVMSFATGDTRTGPPDAVGFPPGAGGAGSKVGTPGLRYFVRSGTARWWGRQPVNVATTDVEDLVVPLHPTVRIQGRVLFAAGVTPRNIVAVRLLAQPANGDPSLGNPASEPLKGTGPQFPFEIDGLMAGTYLLDPLTFGGMAPISVVWDGRDLVEAGFDGTLGHDFNDVVVTLTDKLAELTGVVRDEHGPISAAVIAFPVDRDKWADYGWTPARLRSSLTDSNGAYQLRLPEGEYYVIAVESVKRDAWVSPKFLATAAPHAARISLKWGDKRASELHLQDVVLK
jgi:hypothetical protein